ncbi:MAG: hypothetical protein J6O39_00115 [Treponema sp.]|nr:hypothetical protein [Treponema sp.]
MKRLFLVIAALFSTAFTASLQAQELPEFTKGEAFVFDSQAIPGKADDGIKVKNISSSKYFGITVYGYQNGIWKNTATGFLKEQGDTDTLMCDYRVKKFRYYAVTTNSQSKLVPVISKSHNDLNIMFSDGLPEPDKIDNAAVYDLKEISGRFEDNMKISSSANFDSPCTFFIYGSYSPDSDFTLLTALALKNGSDTDSSDTYCTTEKIKKFRYIKIIPSADSEFSFSLYKKHNDLYIEVK